MRSKENRSNKSTRNRSKIDEQVTEINEHSISGGFGHPKPFRGRAGTRLGHRQDAQTSPRDRSWGAPGEARATRERPKATPGLSRDAPGPTQSAVEARLQHRTESNALAERFFVVFVLSRESPHVPRVPVFTVFCCFRTKLTLNARMRRKRSKIQAFRPPKSSL